MSQDTVKEVNGKKSVMALQQIGQAQVTGDEGAHRLAQNNGFRQPPAGQPAW